jgi:hypothetical protein
MFDGTFLADSGTLRMDESLAGMIIWFLVRDFPCILQIFEQCRRYTTDSLCP